MQKEKVGKVEHSIIKNPFVFKPFNVNDESSVTCVPRISVTQQRVTDQGVNIPEIYVPDLININPNSIANIEKVLLHIETIIGIRDSTHK